MTKAVTTNGQYYINPAYAGTIAVSVLKIATNNTLSSNLDLFMNVDSAASNDVWGGIKRADIINYGAVTSGDSLEWQKAIVSGATPASSSSPYNASLVADELYASWVAQGIGYYGDTSGEPLFLENKYGFEVYNSSGAPIVTITDRLVRYVSYHAGIIESYQSITFTVPGLTNDGTWGFNSEGDGGTYVEVTFGPLGVLNLENLDNFRRYYFIQVFRV